MLFIFFGYPGAGKSTLARRFGELHGVAAIDTDLFMTQAERDAVGLGRYTQAMRLANIARYARFVQAEHPIGAHVALADGLPNDEARRFVLDRFGTGEAVLVLVQAPRALWEQRLAGRSGNPVEIGIPEADAYIRDNWQPVAPDLPHETIENGANAEQVDAQLQALFARFAIRDRPLR